MNEIQLTPRQQQIKKFIKGNLPEVMLREDHIKVLLELVAKSFGDSLESDDLLKTLISIDNIPNEYLADLAQTLGYELDKTLEPQYQRFFMKKFLATRKQRGTALSLKIVGASYAKDAMSYLQSGIPNDIEVVEYGLNDQHYQVGKKEIWKPGVIAVTLLENSNIVKEELLAVTPAGVKLNLNVRQQIDIEKQAVPKIIKSDVYETLLNIYSAMHLDPFSEVANISMKSLGNMTMNQIDEMFRIIIGTDIFTVLESFADAAPIPGSSNLYNLSNIFAETNMRAKHSSVTPHHLLRVMPFVDASSPLLVMKDLEGLTVEEVAELLSKQRAGAMRESSSLSKAVVEMFAKESFRQTTNILKVSGDVASSKEGEYSTDTISGATNGFALESSFYPIGNIWDVRVGELGKLERLVESANTESYSSTGAKLDIGAFSGDKETIYVKNIDAKVESKGSEYTTDYKTGASNGFALESMFYPIGELDDVPVEDIDKMKRYVGSYNRLSNIALQIDSSVKASSGDVVTDTRTFADSGAHSKNADYETSFITGASNGFLLESALVNIKDIEAIPVEELDKYKRFIGSEERLSFLNLNARLSPTVHEGDNEVQLLSSIKSEVSVEEGLYESRDTTVASMQFSIASGVNRVVEYFPYRVDDINVNSFRPEAEITYSYRA